MPPIVIPTELEEHLILSDWLNRKGVWYHHSPNEAKRSVSQWVLLKRMGMKKGFPDFIIPGIINYAIELKRCKKSKSCVSKEQVECLDRLAKCGWETHIAYGAADAIAYLLNKNLTTTPLKRIEVL